MKCPQCEKHYQTLYPEGDRFVCSECHGEDEEKNELFSWENLIEEHIKLTEDWINEGTFPSKHEMIYAQTMKACIDLYRKRREAKNER